MFQEVYAYTPVHCFLEPSRIILGFPKTCFTPGQLLIGSTKGARYTRSVTKRSDREKKQRREH